MYRDRSGYSAIIWSASNGGKSAETICQIMYVIPVTYLRCTHMQQWVCSMNDDEEYANCAAEEEPVDVESLTPSSTK
jgi:hypothetical protein